MSGDVSSLVLSELREVRAGVQTLLDRVVVLSISQATCQARCADATARRGGWIRWVGGIVAALVPAALVYFFKH
jgi:hypothetical protein